MRLDHTIHLHLGAFDTREVLQGHLQHLRPATLEQAGGVTQLQAHAHLAALDIDIAQAAGTERVLIEVRIGELTQTGFDRFAGNDAHGQLRKAE
ncbi:hypothetical protein D9M68_911230 [compost metagenome]